MRTLCAALLGMLLTVPAAAAPINAALGKPVTITGDVGVITCCWPPGPVASLDTIVDGILLADSTQWQTGTVWWDESVTGRDGHPGSANNVVEIDLLGKFLISHLLIQFDNNDSYGIQYRDEVGAWHAFVTAAPLDGFGMKVRQGPFSPFLATGFRIDAHDGDGFYALSEFQATGTPVPEPATLVLFGVGAGAAAVRRRFRRENG